MNVWVSAVFLAVGLFLSSSALTDEECKPMIEPLSMEDHSGMLTVWNLIVGYSDNDVMRSILNLTQSFHFNVTQSPSAPNEVLLTQANRINGTCVSSSSTLTIDGFSGHAQMVKMSAKVQSLKTCESCLLFHLKGTTAHMDEFLQNLHLNSTGAQTEVSFNALYLMAKGTTLEESDLEHFKKQAGCLGFTGEPVFTYDPKNGFCNEDETDFISSQ